jgi:AhpC/TSA antioxidant enzyme
LRETDKQFSDAGIAVGFVVIGTPDEAAEFCARFGDAKRCIADTDKRSYKAMGLEDYNLLRLFSDPDLAKRRKENGKAGFRQNWRATKLKNAAQLPGAALIDANGVVRWLHRGKHPGDLPTMQAMLETVRNMRAVQ